MHIAFAVILGKKGVGGEMTNLTVRQILLSVILVVVFLAKYMLPKMEIAAATRYVLDKGIIALSVVALVLACYNLYETLTRKR